jgi:hypothetical protein
MALLSHSLSTCSVTAVALACGAAMRVIELDSTEWKATSDFYEALLAAVGAPAWHGRVKVALVDSMISDVSGSNKINKVQPPYRIEILKSANLPLAVREHILEVIDLFDRVRAHRRERGAPDAEVSIKLV